MFERRVLGAVRSLAQKHHDEMRASLTASGSDLITNRMLQEYLVVANMWWNSLGDLGEAALGLTADAIPFAVFESAVMEALQSSVGTYADMLTDFGNDLLALPEEGEWWLPDEWQTGKRPKPPLTAVVQAGDVRPVLTDLGGGTVDPSAPNSTGLTGGKVFTDFLAANGVGTQEKLWIYGETPRRNFNGHQQVDGLVFSDWQDPALEIAPQDAWLRTDRYRPGDHWGCGCLVVPYIPNFGEGIAFETRTAF